MKKRGSIMLILLLLSGVVMVIATIGMRTSSLFYELVHDRTAQIAHTHAVQGLMWYGIAAIAEHKYDMQQPYDCSFDRWPLHAEHPYQGTIHAKPCGKGWEITATILRDGQPLSVLSVQMDRDRDGGRIVQWEHR